MIILYGQMYFEWAGFAAYDLLLHVVETDSDFNEVYRHFFVDFTGDRPVCTHSAPTRPAPPTFRMHVRRSPFWVVLHRRCSWDNLLVGFNARIHVTPDIYHWKFLRHFSNALPGV